MDDNAKFESVMVDNNVLQLDDGEGNEKDSLEVEITSEDKGNLTVVAESEYASIDVYLEDPRINEGATSIASGTGKLETTIPFGDEREVTLYVKVTSEDGENSTVKTLKVTRLSNNVNILKIELDDKAATKSEEDDSVYTIDISEKVTNPTIKVTPEEEHAEILIEGKADANNKEIDISGVDKLTITVNSEDKTATKDYTLNINRLSANSKETL